MEKNAEYCYAEQEGKQVTGNSSFTKGEKSEDKEVGKIIWNLISDSRIDVFRHSLDCGYAAGKSGRAAFAGVKGEF